MNIKKLTYNRLTQMRTTPEMWGSLEAVEVQYLLLLEIQEEVIFGQPTDVHDCYMKFLSSCGYKTYFCLVPDANHKTLIEHLCRFEDSLSLSRMCPGRG